MVGVSPLFDLYVTVDWSAHGSPKLGADSIWVSVRDRTDGPRICENHPTRTAAAAALCDLLRSHPAQRILVGFDLPYGCPQGFAVAAGIARPGSRDPWRALWRHLHHSIVDTDTNANNRFEVASSLNAAIGPGPGPFWGTTSDRYVTATLARTKAPGFPHDCRGGQALVEHRLAEVELRCGGLRPFSVWQLAGAGSVGSQTLTGIPVLHGLRHHPALRGRSRVWPFETGFDPDPGGTSTAPGASAPGAIVHAEIWPSELGRPDPALHPVKDAAQVLALGARLAALDAAGELAPRFAPRLDRATAGTAVREEGWVLRVG
jgi:precorrin-8X/cobalt-precorrin-8 methylmutase